MPITSRPSPLAGVVARAKEKPIAPPVKEPKPAAPAVKAAKVKKPKAPKPEPKPEPPKAEPAAPVVKVRDPNKLWPVSGGYWIGGRNFGHNVLRYATTLNLDAGQIIELCRGAMSIETKWNANKAKVENMHDQAFEKAAIEMGLEPCPYVPQSETAATDTDQGSL